MSVIDDSFSLDSLLEDLDSVSKENQHHPATVKFIPHPPRKEKSPTQIHLVNPKAKFAIEPENSFSDTKRSQNPRCDTQLFSEPNSPVQANTAPMLKFPADEERWREKNRDEDAKSSDESTLDELLQLFPSSPRSNTQFSSPSSGFPQPFGTSGQFSSPHVTPFTPVVFTPDSYKKSQDVFAAFGAATSFTSAKLDDPDDFDSDSPVPKTKQSQQISQSAPGASSIAGAKSYNSSSSSSSNFGSKPCQSKPTYSSSGGGGGGGGGGVGSGIHDKNLSPSGFDDGEDDFDDAASDHAVEAGPNIYSESFSGGGNNSSSYLPSFGGRSGTSTSSSSSNRVSSQAMASLPSSSSSSAPSSVALPTASGAGASSMFKGLSSHTASSSSGNSSLLLVPSISGVGGGGGGSKRCSKVTLAGPSCSRGLKSSTFSKCACDNLRCLQCNFKVLTFLSRSWASGADGVDYMFLRNNVPNEVKLSQKLDPNADSCAYCCQCSWTDATGDRVLSPGGNSSGAGPDPQWVCAGHS